MQSSPKIAQLESLVAENPKLIFTMFSYGLILTMYVNLSTFQSPFLGLATSALYFFINGVFLGQAFFPKESTFFRIVLGMLSLIIILGFAGWIAVITYNLELFQFVLVLLIATTLSSLINRKVKNKNALQQPKINETSSH